MKMERRYLSLLGLGFFGLSSELAPEFRLSLFTQIHSILFHGKGGYDYHTVYNMPVWLRKFTFKQISDFYDEKSKAQKSAQTSGKTSLVGKDGKINTPAFKNASKPYQNKSSYK